MRCERSPTIIVSCRLPKLQLPAVRQEEFLGNDKCATIIHRAGRFMNFYVSFVWIAMLQKNPLLLRKSFPEWDTLSLRREHKFLTYKFLRKDIVMSLLFSIQHLTSIIFGFRPKYLLSFCKHCRKQIPCGKHWIMFGPLNESFPVSIRLKMLGKYTTKVNAWCDCKSKS